MDKKNIVSIRVAMILNCICAVVWNILVFMDFAHGFPKALHIICAIIWDVCAVVWVIRYLKARRDSAE